MLTAIYLISKHSTPTNPILEITHKTSESEEACRKLADRGIMLFKQGPILKGINDSTKELKRLYETLKKPGDPLLCRVWCLCQRSKTFPAAGA